MLIGIDGNEANIKNRVGVGQYAYNLLVNLQKVDTKNQYIIYLKDKPAADLPQETPGWHYKVFGPKKLWTKISLPIHLFLQKEKLDLFFSPSHYSPQFCPCPTIPTIHDLGYLQYQDQFTKKDLYQLINWTKSSIKKAKEIVTVSKFSQDEIIKTYCIPKSKITIAYNGVDAPPEISDKESKNTLKKFNISDPYFLYLGTLKPNKNIPFLIKSFSKFLIDNPQLKNHKLVIAGKKGWLFNEIFKTVKDEHLENHVIFTDFITELEKWVLYKNSICFILPSTYEGFGIPLIEAMKIGTPTISSNIDVLKEVVGEAGEFIDLNNINDLSKKLVLMCSDSTRLKFQKLGKVRAEKFSWENTARSVLKAFDKAAA